MNHNVHSTKPAVSFVQRISRKITLFLNQLAPPGYEAKPMVNQTSRQPTRLEFRLPILPRPVANTFVFSELHQIVGRVIDTRIAEGQEITVIENAGGFRVDCSPLRLRPATNEEYALYKEEAADRKSLIGLVSDHSLSA